MYGLRLNGLEKVSIVRGASYTFIASVYDVDTLRPANLTGYDTLKLFVQNEAGTLLELTGTLEGTEVEGTAEFSISGAQSALLALTETVDKVTTYVAAEFEMVTLGGDVLLATNRNMFNVVDRLKAA